MSLKSILGSSGRETRRCRCLEDEEVAVEERECELWTIPDSSWARGWYAIPVRRGQELEWNLVGYLERLCVKLAIYRIHIFSNIPQIMVYP